jgi:cyanuric acid amidohydrolase
MTFLLETFRTQGPGDVAGFSAALRRLPLDRVRRLAVLGKTEGPATLNDASRELAQLAAENEIRAIGGLALLERTWQIFSTGCEGIASPMTALVAELNDDKVSRKPGLAFGAARSLPIAPEERCGPRHITAAADAVCDAMRSAGLAANQVDLVLIKSPIMPAGVNGAPSRSARHAGSTSASRGAAALGAGIALGQIRAGELGDNPVGATACFATKVMAFSGTETDCVETIVLGMRVGGDSAWTIESFHLKDMLDIDPLLMLRSRAAPDLVFFKAGIASSGHLRGLRTTVMTSDLPADKHLRAAASGMIGACFPRTPTFISGGAEHQGEPGACLCAIVRRVN